MGRKIKGDFVFQQSFPRKSDIKKISYGRKAVADDGHTQVAKRPRPKKPSGGALEEENRSSKAGDDGTVGYKQEKRSTKPDYTENFESVRNADDFLANDKDSEVEFLGTQSTVGPVKSHISSAPDASASSSLSLMPFINIEEHQAHHKVLSQKALSRKPPCYYRLSQNVQ
ncbi:hypothetical protein MMC22_002898, partial [Lobaria immixta]|nr:hypothetical protein [Lobaria immixta]